MSPKNYALAAPALMDVTFHSLFAWSVVERHVSGTIYVDQLESPKIFYVVHPYGMSLLYGDLNVGIIDNELKDYLLNKNNVRQAKEWLQLYPVEWETQIDAMLIDKIFIADKHFGTSKKSFTENYKIVKTDDRLFIMMDGSVVPKKFWDNEKDFANRGVGFSLIKDDEWIATAFSSFIHEDQLDLGMETKPEYRKQGYARYVCARLIKHCIEHGFEPLWACNSGNLGSYYLAQKLGFEPVRYLPYYELKV